MPFDRSKKVEVKGRRYFRDFSLMAVLAKCSLMSWSVFAESPPCSFSYWQNYRQVALYRNQSGSAYHFQSSTIELDSDGAPNAYHPEDVGKLCRGSHPFKGLDCPANAGYPNSRWQNVLAADPSDNTQAYAQPSGEFAGFFVSKTSLFNPNVSDPVAPERYVDATKIPYIVFPGKFYRLAGTGLMGDLGIATNLDNGKEAVFVVADKGPNAELGEISLRLAELLGGVNPNPRTGAGAPQGTIRYVVFPYSTRQHPWPLSVEQMEERGRQLLEQIGGNASLAPCQGPLGD